MIRVDGIIFDMNGVIVDDNEFHKQAFFELCKNHSRNLTEKEFKENISGRRNKDIFNYLFGNISSKQFREFENEKESLYRSLYKPFKKPIPGLVDFLYNAKEVGTPLAIATGAPIENRSYILDDLCLRDFFSAIVGPEDISKGKPDPEIFLTSAKLLGVNPKYCIGIEDSISGFKAIKAAGMYCIGITTTHKYYDIRQYCDKVIDDFTEIGLR